MTPWRPHRIRRGESALDLAAALLAEYGGLAGVAAARPEELARRPGMGPAKGAALIAEESAACKRRRCGRGPASAHQSPSCVASACAQKARTTVIASSAVRAATSSSPAS